MYFNFDEEVEVKGGEDKSAPSFKKYVQEKEPKTALRFSKRGYRKDGNVTNVPLYLARKDKRIECKKKEEHIKKGMLLKMLLVVNFT